MTYAQSGLIQATDYNTLIGTSPSSTINTLNTVWAVGSGSAGYGQTAVSAVSVSSTITATQWASLINTLNSARIHQSGSGSGISAPTAGTTINYLSTLQTSIDTAYTSRLSFASNSAAITNVSSLSAYPAWSVASTSSTLTRSFGARANFPSADQARYFFNSGGRLKFNISAVNNLGSNTRSAAVAALFANLGGISLFAAAGSAGRTGTGGTLGTNLTTTGYYQITTANVTHVSVTSTTTNYTTDTATIAVKSNGTQGSNNDNGFQIDFWTNITSTSGGNSGGSFDDSINVTPTATIDVSYPETTNLSNTWGTITCTQL